jgi:hypothetical protein
MKPADEIDAGVPRDPHEARLQAVLKMLGQGV